MVPDDEKNPPSGLSALSKSPKTASLPSGFSDPRRVHIILRLVDSIPGCSTALLLHHLRDDLEWQLQDPSRLPGRLQTSASGLERLRRELLHLGWLMESEAPNSAEASLWWLSPAGENLVRDKTLTPESLSLRWCVDSNEVEDSISRLLERLWLLSPDSQGQVIFALPSVEEPPPADRANLGAYLIGLYTKWWVPLVQHWCPRWEQILPAKTLGVDALRQQSHDRLAARWPRLLTEAQRRTAVQEQLTGQLRAFLFGDILPPTAVETWQRRMDWAGLSLSSVFDGTGRIWFPVGVFRNNASPAFQFVSGLVQGQQTYAVYAPAWPIIRTAFATTLGWAYFHEQKLHQGTYVSLHAVRDLVCQKLRLGHFRFVECLQQAFTESVTDSFPYHLSLEVDRTPSDRQRQARELPIEVDGAPRYIVAIQRR